MKDLLAHIYGDDFVSKITEFEKRLDAIEKENIEWFKSQPARFENEEHDKLEHHYVLAWNSSGRVMFSINGDSILPNPIKDKCKEAFKDVFGEKLH